MNIASAQVRYCAASMRLAAYLDGHYVEMHVLTNTGETIAIVCERDSIYSVQRHIEKMGRDCPEIATWKPLTNIKALHENAHGFYEPRPPSTSLSILSTHRPPPGRPWLWTAAYMIAGLVCFAIGLAVFAVVGPAGAIL